MAPGVFLLFGSLVFPKRALLLEGFSRFNWRPEFRKQARRAPVRHTE